MSHRPNWHNRYLSLLTLPESFCLAFNRLFFTFGTAIAHVIVYAAVMNLEGGDFHLFLDGISIEAIFVGIFIGIAQNAGSKRDKVAQEQRDHMQLEIETLIQQNTKLTEEIHAKVVPGLVS